MENFNKLKLENEQFKKENEKLKDHLKKYTTPSRNKIYYENHKEELKEKARDYRKNTNYKPPNYEKRKEYAKKYYQKKKLEKQELEKNIQNLCN